MNFNPPQKGKINSSIEKAKVGPVLLILFLAILFRGLYLIDSSDNPTFKMPVVDARTYDQIARRVAEEGNLLRDLSWQPRILNILATVYAATGYFDRAKITARKALELAISANDHDLTARIQKQIDIYQQRQ